MTDLNADLQSYLSSSTKSTKNWFSGTPTVINVEGEKNNNYQRLNKWFGPNREDSLIPSLGRKQRIMGFVFCIVIGLFCFSLAGLYFPMLLIKTRKFALLYTVGSLFFIFSFSVLWGPLNHLKHLFSVERLPFALVYFGTMSATLYSALWMRSTILTGIFAIAQVLALFWYITSYIPGGQTGLKFMTKMFTKTVSTTASKTLPV